MPVIVEIHSFSGAATPIPFDTTGLTATKVDGENVRFKRAADNVDDLTNPIKIPSTGIAYSWRKFTKIYVKEGLVGAITNIQWYAEPEHADTPGAWKDQIVLYVQKSRQYVQPTAADETGLVTNGVDPALEDANLHDSDSSIRVDPNLWGPDSAPGIILNASYGLQFFIVMQLGVRSTCTSEAKLARDVTYRFYET